jgi:hypothetical protein
MTTLQTTMTRALRIGRSAVTASIGAASVVACSQSPVGNLNAPSVGLNPTAFQARVIGALATQRADFGTRVLALDAFARNAANFTTTDNRYITMWLGDAQQIGNSTYYGTTNWAGQFVVARQINTIFQDLPNATPAYSAPQRAKLTGILQTIKALSFMYAAETRDTLGVPIAGVDEANPNTPAPILCARDTWRAIVALLDSGLASLNADTSAGLPVTLVQGMASVSQRASPSTAAGSFASFNRALAAKAGLELAYAIARSPGGTAPTPTTAGAPDAGALTRADSALHASALYNPGVLAPPAAGDFTEALAVYHTFSGASGDIANPMQGFESTYYILNEAIADIDPADKRLSKLMPSPFGAAGTPYNAVASGRTLSMYQNATSPMPIVRNEELTLIEAQIRLGLGDLAGAVAAINTVRTAVAGLPPVNPATYTAVRNQILKELRASTIGEPSGDRAIAIRHYALASVVDTTWGANDTHATVQPLPVNEADARNGNTAVTCQ